MAEQTRPLWMKATACVMAVVTYLLPGMLTLDEVAHAAPIVDPRAPIPFQPTITQTSTGIPAVNIAAPNANGISVNSYQSFNIDSNGLVLNNSLTSGTPLLGGTLGANPNLAGRAASVIVNQVTTTGPASTLVGPLEVFGSPASLIISNPNGVSVNGLSLTNATGLVLTTGTPQFLTGVGGASTDFAHAGSLAYNVTSGNVSINGPAGVNGPGVGIEGTVGNIDVIAQTISLNAPLRADQRINLVTGNQLVSPTASDASGTNYGTAANGAANTAAAIGNNAVAIDANQYGSVTSGQIYIVSTAAGMGVNTQGALTATAGNLTVTSNGDIAVNSTYAQQAASLTGAGKVSMSGGNLANQYTVSASGDIAAATASVQSVQDLNMNAGGGLNLGTAQSNGSVNLRAGADMSVGAVQTGNNLSMTTTGSTGNGDMTIGGAVSAPGVVALSAARDVTVNGAVTGGSTVHVLAQRNATVNGRVSSSGDLTLAGQTGNVTTTGDVQTSGNLSATAGRTMALGGNVAANGNATLIAGADLGVSGTLAGNGTGVLSAGGNLTANGAVTFGQNAALTAGQNVNLPGAVTAGGTLNVTAGNSLTVGSAAAAGDTTLAASGGAATINGAILSGGNTAVSAATDVAVAGSITGNKTGKLSGGRDVSSTGSVTFGQDAIVTAGRNANLAAAVKAGGNFSVTAGSNVTVGGAGVVGNTTLTGTSGAVTVNGALATGGNTIVSAATDAIVSGAITGNGTGNLSAGRNLSGGGTAGFGSDATLSAGQAINLSGSLQTGGNLSATAGTGLTVGAATAVGNTTLKANGGDAAINGAVLSGGDLNAQAAGNLTVTGSVTSLGKTALTAQGGNLSAQGGLNSAGDATLAAAQTLAVTGTTQVGGDATLTGANISTGGTTTVAGNLKATSQNSLDLSAGQLNVVKNATLSGANVTTGNALIGGNLSANASNQLTMAGAQTLVQGSATLSGQNAVVNTGGVLAGGALTVTGASVTNAAKASLISTAATTVNATNLNNQGSIAGLTTAVTANGALTNNGGAIIGTNSLNVTTGNLAGNNNGVIFAGSTSATNPGTPADATVTVTGGNGTFNNTGGQILAQHNLTLNLLNQAFDPSAASSGTFNLGNALTINTLQLNNAGTWAMPGNSVSINATQGFSNSGTISKAGDITLSTSGTLTNSGTISAGNDVNLSGTIVNQAGGTIHANEDVNLNGTTTNQGTIGAVRDINLNGSSYDNTGASTAAGRNLTANLSGDLTNVGGKITAQNDITINAANVNNSQAGANTTTTTTSATTIAAAGMGAAFLSTPIGSLTFTTTELSYADGSVTGSQTFTTSITGRVGDMQLATATTPVAPDLSGGTFYGIALPTVTQTTTTTQPTGQSSVIAAGHDLSITTGALNNHGSKISAGNNVTLNVASLDNGGDAATTTITDSSDAASYASFLAQLKTAYTAGTVVPMLALIDGGLNLTGEVASPTANVMTSAPPPAQTSTLTVYTSQNAGQIVAGNDLSLTGTGGGLTNAGSLYAGQDLRVTASSFTNQGYHIDRLTSSTGCAAGVSATNCGYFGTNSGPTTYMYERPGQQFTDAMTNAALAQYLVSGYSVPFGPGNDTANLYADRTVTQTYSYTQTDNTVFAGRDLIIAVPTVNNTYGNLLAGRDVVIGGTGTTRSNTDPNNPQTNLTQASGVTNTSGNIQAGRDLAISTAALTNTMSAPVQVYQNYGTTAQFGCSGASVHYCDAFVDQQSGDASTITANRNLSFNVGTLVNTGSLITAGSQASISAASSVTNQDQTLNAYWHDAFFGIVIGGSKPPDNFGCGTAANCSTLFGSAYHGGDSVQPPTPYKSLSGTIQAPSLSVTAGGQLQNSGNVLGRQVALTGSTLVNGMTSPAVYTPQPTGSNQVVPLGPVGTPVVAANAAILAGGIVTIGSGLTGASGVAGGIAASSSGSLGTAGSTSAGVTAPGNAAGSITAPALELGPPPPPVSPGVAVATGASATSGAPNINYLVNSPASLVIGNIGPSQLLANLPASLQPTTTQFYYDPFTENQLLQQAALAQTGQASFVSGLSYDNTKQSSVTDQEKKTLYGNAIQYAEANNIALGTALTQNQIATLDKPMLWYVEETVPEPGCTATGTATCPTVDALMPQVYLPQNYAVVQHDGTISGQDVTLTASNGGSITNTGSITATGTLTVNAGSLTNEQRSTDIGTQSTYIPDLYELIKTTGTVAQQGGFMSAGNYQLNVDAVNSIGGTLQKLNADGTVDTAGTQQQLAALKAQLGSSFTQSTVQNDLHTSVTSLADSEGMFQTIGMLAVMVVASVMTAGAASAAIGAGAPVGSTFAAGTAATAGSAAVPAGLANIALSAGIAGMTSSALGQAANGTFSLNSMLVAGATAFVTAGLTNGITVSDGTPGWTWTASPNSLASLAGVQSVGNALVPQAGQVTASTVLAQGAAIAGEATIQAGVQTALGGGSFLTNLRNSAVADVAAAGAYAIGNANAAGDFGTGVPGELGYVAAHSLLGCAASAAEGNGCASGALGAASSAVVTPFALAGIDPNETSLNLGQTAAIEAIAVLAGGAAAGALGQNVTAGATWAQNEALNNDSATPEHIQAAIDGVKSVGAWINSFGTALVSSAGNAAKQGVLQLYDNTFYSGVPGSPGPQSELYQSVVQNGLAGTAQAMGSNFVSAIQAAANGNPTAIGSLAGGIALGAALGGIAGGAEAAATADGVQLVAGIENGTLGVKGSASSRVPTGGDFDLPSVYNSQVQSAATNNAPLGLGSTGRAVPNNLQEQLALQQAMSNPAAGVQLPIPLGDSRWPATDGWVKMSQNVNGVEIHYVRNVNSGAVDDFKFK
ncbi:filamentous hemagglutinin N-terminal domain-containing protein [Paraburkholderia fungorum]|uniref:beta strand repeat-containing protein n=1 Tax=Paraburkholderia fungorum TaxID=134537 RepID=UPI0038BDAA28